jgi:F0F1-type ATP synthase assembly protein I
MPDEKERSKLALALSVGTVISSNVIGGVLAGYLLDGWLKTGPWLITTGLILGAISAFVGLFRILNRLNR